MYKIDRSFLKLQKIITYVSFSFFFVMLLMFARSLFSFQDETSNEIPLFFLIFFLVFVGVFIFIVIQKVRSFKEKEQKYDYLEQYGRLAKNAQFSVVPTGKYRYGEHITQVMIHDENCKFDESEILNYELENDEMDGFMHFGKMPDVLYDPQDPTNYYIAREIEEI